MREFLSGRTAEAKAPQAADKLTRERVAEELLTAMKLNPDATETDAAARDRARQLYFEHGYFDEAIESLRGADSPVERAAAADALGDVGSQRATAHLIAAVFDEDSAVRAAAEKALGKINDISTPAPSPPKPLESPDTNEVVSAAETSPVETELVAAEQPANVVSEVTGQLPAAEKTPPEEAPRQRGKAAKTKFVEPQLQVETPAGPDDPFVSDEEKRLLQSERDAWANIDQLQKQLLTIANDLSAAHNEAQWRAEREAKLRAEATARLREEEELRKKMEQEAAERRLKEQEALAGEESARTHAESERRRLAEEEARLWMETSQLRVAAEEAARKRIELEAARRNAAHAAQLAEAARAHDEAEQRHQAQLAGAARALDEAEQRHRAQLAEAARALDEAERKHQEQLAEAVRARDEAEQQHQTHVSQLRHEEEKLRKATGETAARRAEVEAARERQERDAEKLVEARARMQAAEEAQAKAEAERAQIEAELHQRVEAEERRLAEARRLAEEEQARLTEEARRHQEAEEARLAELEVSRERAEREHQQRLAREHEIIAQIEKFRAADAETRKRITEAEARRNASEQSYRVVADKVQRIETEAHATAQKEEQIIAKLETARRNAANEAQARAEQEKRIKEEIDMFRRLEDEERPRLEALMLQRAAAETLLNEARERARVEEQARAQAEERARAFIEARMAAETVEQETVEELAPAAAAVDETTVADVSAEAEPVADQHPEVPPAIASYLHSVDPYKRAAAVAELARSQASVAFPQIARCFDDHSPLVRNAAARALRKLEPQKTVDLFNRAIEEGSEERRKNIGAAIAESGVAAEAIENLVSESREETYNALSMLFVMAKSGEIAPLVQAVEEHENEEVCRAAIKLLTLSANSEAGDAALQRRLMGVPASRHKAAGAEHNEIPDFRLRIAEVEVKRALNQQQPEKHD